MWSFRGSLPVDPRQGKFYVHPDTRSFWRTRDSSARKAAVKYAVDAVNYLMDAAGSSLPTEIYYLSQVRVTCNMRATFDTIPGTNNLDSPFQCIPPPPVRIRQNSMTKIHLKANPSTVGGICIAYI